MMSPQPQTDLIRTLLFFYYVFILICNLATVASTITAQEQQYNAANGGQRDGFDPASSLDGREEDIFDVDLIPLDQQGVNGDISSLFPENQPEGGEGGRQEEVEQDADLDIQADIVPVDEYGQALHQQRQQYNPFPVESQEGGTSGGRLGHDLDPSFMEGVDLEIVVNKHETENGDIILEPIVRRSLLKQQQQQRGGGDLSVDNKGPQFPPVPGAALSPAPGAELGPIPGGAEISPGPGAEDSSVSPEVRTMRRKMRRRRRRRRRMTTTTTTTTSTTPEPYSEPYEREERTFIEFKRHVNF